jgi:RNA polymerase sigma-70 factor, ECF subfamily
LLITPRTTQPSAQGENIRFRDNSYMDSARAGTEDQPGGTIDPIAADFDEPELVASILRKDRKAAARFVAAHIDAVYGYARQRLAPRVDLVDDVVQDVFVAALRGLAAFQGQSSLRSWLIGIARHKVEDVYRQRLRAPGTLDDSMAGPEPETDAVPLDEQIDARRARDKAQRILERLPERYGLLLLWRYWEQRSTREMATAIGTTEKSVERALARARGRFKELWLKE